MIVRTPPVKKRRGPEIQSPPPSAAAGPLVIYEDHPSSPSPLQPTDGDSSHHMLCTYQCRQMVKSEFLDALSNAEKQVEDYKSRLEALNDNFCKVELERKKFRDQYLYTEQELSAAQGREQALQEQQLKEVHDFQERFSKQIRSYTELEVKLQNEINLRMKAETSAASAEEKASVLEGKLSHLSESIEREKRHLNNDLAHIKKESKLSAARINADLERMECRARNAEKESQLLKGQLDDLKNQLNECLQQKSEAETKLSTLTFQEVKCTDNDILVKHLQEELRNFEAEVRAAKKLKSSHEDVKLLNEKLLEEKGRRERAESELSKLQEFQSSMKKLEDELTSWKLTTKDIPGVSCCDDIPVKFGALQKEVIDSMKREGEATARLKQLEVALDAALIGKQNAETEAELMRERLEVTKSEVKRIELMLSRVTEERDKLRNDINEFKPVKSDGAVDEATSRTLKLGHGDFSAANTKVLRMVNTLTVDNEAKQTIEALRTELQKTRERLEAVEEFKSQSGEAGKWVDSNISGKIVQLKEQIATLEKREERYKTVFADRISVFRRACCELFGYKIVMDEHQRPNGIPVTRFTLQSIYAQSDDEKLEFEYESGTTNIMANDYTSQREISQQVDIFIRKMNSIPAFTANLTVESFNRRTLS